MPQIPALFLSKKLSERNKSQNKEPQKIVYNSIIGSNKKVSALLKGRVDGNEENNSKVRRTT